MTGHVTGIGGVFFRAQDPEALGAWYAEHLGLVIGGPWPQAEGVSVFSPHPQNTEYWPEAKQWMLNLRVSGLDALVERLGQAGIPAELRPDEWDHPQIGRFARITDPEGNSVELWEPPPSA